MASVITAQLLFLESENPKKDIYMYINSPGGVVTAGMAIHDTMQYIRPRVGTVCIGQAASMGVLPAVGRRARDARGADQRPDHDPPAVGRGPGHGVGHRDPGARKSCASGTGMNELYAQYTGQPIEEIERRLDRDNFLSAEEAKAFGLVDEVFDKRPMPIDEETQIRGLTIRPL